MKLLAISFLFVFTKSYTQITNQLKGEREFKNFVYESLNSFKIINEEKYYSIHGIDLKLDKNGILKDYIITFGHKKQLTKKEYRFLFKKLISKNYKNCILLHYSEDELQTKDDFFISIRFIPE